VNETQPETSELPKLQKREPVPTWGRDFRRALGVVLFGVLFFTFLVWAAKAGLVRYNHSYERIEGDPLWTGICAGGIVFMFPFLFLEYERSDN
jgi:succinate dehydrogenase/fumarate reductase cytochrome b subunit